jgi:hypothetical protein
MSNRNETTREFEELFAQWREGVASPEQIDRLESLVAADAQLAERYVEMIHLHVQLQWSLGSVPEHDLPAIPQEDSAVRLYESEDLPKSKRLPEAKALSSRALLSKVGFSVAVAILVAVGTLYWKSLPDQPGLPEVAKAQAQPAKETPFIAWLSGSNEAKWVDGTQPSQSQLKPGSRLTIESGQVRIQYLTGTEVVIQGPAEYIVGKKADEPADQNEVQRSPFVLDPANSGYLVYGRLIARCETLRSKGFVVNTPTAHVKDLGTEFGVAVEGLLNTAVHVMRGEVETCLIDDEGSCSILHALTGGHSQLLDAKRESVNAIEYDTTELPTFAAIPQSRPVGVIVSDSFGSDGAASNYRTGNMQDRTPDGINLPGLKWENFNGASYWNGQAVLGGDTGARIALNSYGGYIRPDVLELSADVTLGDLTDGGDGGGGMMLGFATDTAPEWQNWKKYTGLVLHQDGRLQYRELGVNVGPAIAYGGNFSNKRTYHFSYVVDTTTGAIRNVHLEGSSADYSFSVGSYQADNYKCAMIFGNAGGPRQQGQLDNLNVSEFVSAPE